MKTPEKAEDVEGEWIEYGIDDVEALSHAAEGTGWCVASQSVAEDYLGEGVEERFIFFHLKDPATGELADNAAASIRLNEKGKVAEVSGLVSNGNENQGVEDALLPVVEEKVQSLPGGEEFLEKIADKKKLIEMDRKYQAGEMFNRDEIDFVFEMKRKIKPLNNYGSDVRIEQFKRNIIDNFAQYKDMVDINVLVRRMDSDCVCHNLECLLEHGADIDRLAKRMGGKGISRNLEYLIEHGADAYGLVERMDSWDIPKNFEYLIEHGADINGLVERVNSWDIPENLEYLVEHGVDANGLVERMGKFDIPEKLEYLVEHGADINKLVKLMDPGDIDKNRHILAKYGIDQKYLDDIIF